jgi:hypothetical protein
MTKKAASAQLHHVRQYGTLELKFEVAPKDRARRGIRRQTPVKECIIKFDGTCCFSCMRPKLLHIPCSHVMAACADIGHPVDIYVSHYFRKETIASTWQYDIYGFRMLGSFTEAANPVIYIPDPRTARVKRGRRQIRRIRNDMDESELRTRIQRCSTCNQSGHTINVIRTMMLSLVLLKLALQVMLQMEDLRLHQGVEDVADRVLLRHQASFSCNFI